MICVWLGTSGDACAPVTLTNDGDVLLGHGPSQSQSTGIISTLGSVRTDWGDPSVAPYLADACPCSMHLIGNSTMLIMVPVAGVRDYTTLPGCTIDYPAHMPAPSAPASY